MWGEAIKVAIVGFTVVFIGLWILMAGVKIMSFFCRLVTKKEKKGHGKEPNHANI